MCMTEAKDIGILTAEIQKGAPDMRVLPDVVDELIMATTVLLKDLPPRQVDSVFFFGRSWHDAGKRDIFTTAAEHVTLNKAQYLLLADSEGERVGENTPLAAYPGKSLWTQRLTKLGVNQEQIIYSPHLVTGERGFHTKSEAEAFLQTAVERKFRTAVVLTQPHQILRAMLGVVKVINEKNLQINVWCVTPESTDWDKEVKGSQGMKRKPRREHILDEVERILKYQDQGDIASFDELFAYLERRNKHI